MPREPGVPHLLDWAGERWSPSTEARDALGTQWVRGRHGEGHSRVPGVIHYGGNGGYQMIELATQFGARQIVLLGYDMERRGDQVHWHGRHPVPLGNCSGDLFVKWRRRLGVLAADLRVLGVDVINCSRHSALTCFDRRPLEDTLQ
ncbi:MAG TPA: hypothetical protein DCZ11_03000 [Gammaproteobacteria bacterium]|nr:hypothetical protein [Gammaproteobacteria bacterium]MCH77393.1 hypothetical protein [Gammaproteobacteria bacterium]